MQISRSASVYSLAYRALSLPHGLFAALALVTVGLAQSPDNKDKRVFNVVDFGATPNSAVITDDTPAIQSAITTAINTPGATGRDGRGAVIFFPEGVFHLVTPLTIPSDAVGFEFHGAAAHEYGTVLGEMPSPLIDCTSLVGQLPAGGTLITCNAGYVKFRDLVLIGRVDDMIQPTIMKTTNTTGWVDGLHFCNVKFREGAIGLDVGTAATESMNSDMYFEDVGFWNCGIGMRVNNNQGLLYHFDMLRAANCPCVIRMQEGGLLAVKSATISDCGSTDPNQWIFDFVNGGINNGMNELSNVRIEQASYHFIRVRGQTRVQVNCMHDVRTGPAEPMADTASANGCLIQVLQGEVAFNSCQFKQTRIVHFKTNGSAGAFWDNRAIWRIVSFRSCGFQRWVVPPTTFPATGANYSFTDSDYNTTDARCYLTVDKCDARFLSGAQWYGVRPLADKGW
jgi:hypothetical protein